MIHDLQIVVADLLDGKTALLYLGTDITKADEAFTKADAKAEAVRLFSYPQPSRIRFPSAELDEIYARAKLAATQDAGSLEAKRAAAATAATKAKEAADHAKKLAADLAKFEKPETRK